MPLWWPRMGFIGRWFSFLARTNPMLLGPVVRTNILNHLCSSLAREEILQHSDYCSLVVNTHSYFTISSFQSNVLWIIAFYICCCFTCCFFGRNPKHVAPQFVQSVKTDLVSWEKWEYPKTLTCRRHLSITILTVTWMKIWMWEESKVPWF